jgi:hypothetical protein
MAIGNVEIVTMGWYSSVAADTPGSVPDGEEIHGWGWIDGVIAAAPSTIGGVGNTIRWWPLIPKRSKHKRR